MVLYQYTTKANPHTKIFGHP